MNTIHVEARIQAPLERVFEVFVDLPNAAERIAGIQRVELLTSGPMAVGTRWRETRVMYGREATEEMWITAFEPPHRYVAEAESHGAHYRSTFTFREENGETVARMEFGAEPLSLFATIMNALMFKAMAKSVAGMLAQDMQDLKRACEAPVAQP